MSEAALQTPLLEPSQAGMDAVAERPQRLEDRAAAGSSWCVDCCLGRAKLELDRAERDSLWELRNDCCNEPFDADSADTNLLLVEIWNGAMPTEPIQAADKSDRWPRLGFQSSNPRTDVRTGRYALAQFHYFVTTYPDRARQLVRQAEELEYPLAVTCFNLTHMVVVFFDLYNSDTVSPVSGATQANLQQIKHFAGLCRDSRDPVRVVLNELVCALTELLHETWKHMRATDNVNLMDFPKAMRAVYEDHSSFWSQPRSEIAEFRFMLAADRS